MEEEKTIKEEIRELTSAVKESNKPKEKKFRLPFKARVGKRKLKQGYVITQEISENKEINFTKHPIIDGTIKTLTGVHAIDELDIFTYKGRPFAHIPSTKINPWNPLSDYLNETREYDGKKINKNEIYGQKYVMARMKSDFISAKGKFGWGASIFGIVILGIIAYAFITGG